MNRLAKRIAEMQSSLEQIKAFASAHPAICAQADMALLGTAFSPPEVTIYWTDGDAKAFCRKHPADWARRRGGAYYEYSATIDGVKVRISGAEKVNDQIDESKLFP